jgi:hypothetical protein
VYPVAPLDGLASETPGSVVIINAIQTIRFPAPILKAVMMNDDSVHGPSLPEEHPVGFLARHESSALIKYVLRHSVLEGQPSFEMIQDEIYFTNTSKNDFWIAHLALALLRIVLSGLPALDLWKIHSLCVLSIIVVVMIPMVRIAAS